MKNILLTIVALLLGLSSPNAAEPITPAETPPEPTFNKLSDFDDITALLKGYAAAYPNWVKLETIGKSTEGRDMWLLTLNNPATGNVLSKPAMWIHKQDGRRDPSAQPIVTLGRSDHLGKHCGMGRE